MTHRDAPTLVHVTTTDMSLALLLGPQLRAFADAGFRVLGMSADGPFVEQLADWGIDHVPIRNATRSMSARRDLAALGELTRLFRRLQPDIVHTHNPKPGVYGRLAAAAARVPVVVNTVHGLYATPGDRLRKRAVVYGLERIAATASDAELVQNPEDLEVLKRLRVPVSKLVLLGNGVDLGRFTRPSDAASVRERMRAELNVDPDAVLVGVVGRLVWEKGLREVFEAARTLRRGSPVRFVVVGPEDDSKSDAVDVPSRAQAEQDGVIFVGQQSRVEDYYLAFDVFLLASHREGFPRSAMEAAALGLPVIATDIRGCRQVVEHGRTGLLVRPRSAAAIVDAVSTLAADPALQRSMGSAGAEKARREFDDRQVIDRTLCVYRRLLGRGRRRQ